MSSNADKYNLYHLDCDSKNLSIVTLRTILEGHEYTLTQFTYIERLKVGLALSYSILHLYNTDWLARLTEPDDIIFIRERRGPTSHVCFLDRPFLAKSLSNTSGGHAGASSQHISSTQSQTKPMNLTTLSLGLLLTQIIIGRHIKDLKITQDMSLDAVLDKQNIASQMAGLILENGGMNYEAAVRWCLHSFSSVVSSCLENDNFSQEFYNAVIFRLESDLKLQSSPVAATA